MAEGWPRRALFQTPGVFAMSQCTHVNFSATVGVCRLTETKGGPVTGYVAEVRVNCADCGKPFQFLGLDPGLDTQGARVSLDGLEASLALVPQGERPNPFQRMAYTVGNFDG
jgi:hypothetical protein